MFKTYRGIPPLIYTNTVFPSLFEQVTMYVGAATGNQKIVCGELALCREFQNPNARCVYVAAIPEICNARYRVENMFGRGLGKTVVQLTGNFEQPALLKQGHIIISTCAHWDQMSRR